MTSTENLTMHASKRRFARLSLVALGFLLACGEPTAPVHTSRQAQSQPQSSRRTPTSSTSVNGLLNVTNGVTTLVGDLLPCAVTTDQWNTASIGPKGGRLNVGPHSLVIPAGRALAPDADHGPRGARQQRPRGVLSRAGCSSRRRRR